MNTDKMLSTNLLEYFRIQAKNNFDTLFNTPKSLPSVFLNGTNAYISVANNPDINFGTGTFSYIGEHLFESGTTTRYKLSKTASNVGFMIYHGSNNKVIIWLNDGTNSWTLTSTNAIIDGKMHVIGFVKGIDSASSKLYIDGIEDTTAVKSGTFPTGTLTTTATMYIGSANGAYHKNETRLNRLFNYGLTISQFQKYSYEDLAYEDVGASNVNIIPDNDSNTFVTDSGYWGGTNITKSYTGGEFVITATANSTAFDTYINKTNVLTIGKNYKLTFKAKAPNRTNTLKVSFGGGYFTDVINPNLTPTYQNYEFVANNVTESRIVILAFGSSGNVVAGDSVTIDNIVVQQIGCVLNLTPDTINPLKWNCKNGLYYADLINGEAINLPINHNANVVYKGITGNSTVVVPKGYAIEMIYIKNTTANAITGGIKLISGGTDVLNALAIGANYNDVIEDTATVTKKFFSDTANATLYLQAVSSWNNASLNFALILRRVV